MVFTGRVTGYRPRVFWQHEDAAPRNRRIWLLSSSRQPGSGSGSVRADGSVSPPESHSSGTRTGRSTKSRSATSGSVPLFLQENKVKGYFKVKKTLKFKVGICLAAKLFGVRRFLRQRRSLLWRNSWAPKITLFCRLRFSWNFQNLKIVVWKDTQAQNLLPECIIHT